MTESERTARTRQLAWWGGFVVTLAWALLATVLAYQERMPNIFRDHDKVVHFCVAGALAFFLDGALKRRMIGGRHVNVPMASVVLLVPMALEEYLQRYATFRTASFGDFAADFAGVVALTWLSRRAGRWSETRGPNPGDDGSK
jgi:VanZ family protein